MNITSRVVRSVCLLLLLAVVLVPVNAIAVYVGVFQLQSAGTSGNPLPYGGAVALAWYCNRADGTRLWDYYAFTYYVDWYSAYNYNPNSLGYWGGEYGSYSGPMYGTKTFWLGCQDNQSTGYDHAWAATTVYGISCPAAESASAGGYILYSGATRHINVHGYSDCYTNYNGYHVFVPVNSVGEFTSFRAGQGGIGITSAI